MKYIFSLLLLLSFHLTASAGGPWTQKQGAYYLKLSEWWINFDSHYNSFGNRDANPNTSLYSTYLYGEYGITDRFTAILNTPIFVINEREALLTSNGMEIREPAESLKTIGDIDLGLKYRLNKKDALLPLALELKLGINSGKTNQGKFNKLATGDGEFNQMVLLHAGKGFNILGLKAYAQAYTGINNRTNGYSEELRFGGEFGIGIIKQRLWLSAKLNGVKSFKNGKEGPQVKAISLFSNNVEYLSPSIELNGYITKKIGLSAAYTTASSAENIAAASTYSVGAFFNMK